MSKAQASSMNPLNNPLVIFKIFSYLRNVSDLKSVRLVSKIWRVASLPYWTQSATIRLLWRRESNLCKCQLTPTLQSIFKDNTLDISEYLKLMETFEGKAFVRYRIINFCILHPIRDDVDVKVNEFWEIYGKKIKYLHLDHANFHNLKLYQGIRWLLSEKCWNLEELIIPLDKFPSCDPPESFRDESAVAEWRKDDKKAVHLKYLRLKECKFAKCLSRCYKIENYNGSYYNTCVFSPLHNKLRVIVWFTPNLKGFDSDVNANYWNERLFQVNCKLEKLSLGRRSSDGYLDYHLYRISKGIKENMLQLTTLNLNLKSFDFRDDIVEKYPDYLCLKSIFSTCSSTLQNLSLRLYDERGTAIVPISSSLEGFIFLSLAKLCIYDEPIMNFKALGGMPKLKSLHLETDHVERSYAVDRYVRSGRLLTLTRCPGFLASYNWNHKIHQECSKLGNDFKVLELKRLHVNYNRFRPSSLEILQKWMPNISSLEIMLTEKTQVLANQLWPEFKSLKNIVYEEEIKLIRNQSGYGWEKERTLWWCDRYHGIEWV